jgi:peptidoglycan/xylan/chitin deacetylase (PgdA/CDA1 family)
MNAVNPSLVFTCDLEFSPKVYGRLSVKDERLIIGQKALVDLLHKYDVTCTFFTQGKLCLQCPEMVEDLHSEGHEIGSHGFDHIPMKYLWPVGLFPKISPAITRQIDIKKSKEAVFSIIGEKPISFRAPYLAMDQEMLPFLEKEGFLFDSSLYNPALGKVSSPYHPSAGSYVSEGHMKIWEVPPTVNFFPQRKYWYYRYPLILSLDEQMIRKSIPALIGKFLKNDRYLPLFVTIIHPYELCSPSMVSKVSLFLDIMKKNELRSIALRDLLKESNPKN